MRQFIFGEGIAASDRVYFMAVPQKTPGSQTYPLLRLTMAIPPNTASPPRI
jgi:hypothetical protein